MANAGFQQFALFEHRFWLQILGDHARFIFTSLAPNEADEIQRAQYFIRVFDELLETSRRDAADTVLPALNQRALQHSQQLRDFKLHLIIQHLVGKIDISLPPTFLNHMVNELEEYLRILSYLIQGSVPPKFHVIHHHLLWLLDAIGHATAISSRLDYVEKKLLKKSKDYEKHFEQFYLKAVEIAGYMRANISQFPALQRFNKEVNLEIAMFTEFLHELEEMRLDAEVLGVLSPLMADHMAREQCYYLMKVSEVSELKAPDCDPAKPRIEK